MGAVLKGPAGSGEHILVKWNRSRADRSSAQDTRLSLKNKAASEAP